MRRIFLAAFLGQLPHKSRLGLIFEVRGSLTTTSALLAIFLLALGYAILMEMDIDCGCFTVDELNAKTSAKHAFFRDLAMVAATIFLFWWRRVKANPPVSKTGK